MKQVRTSKWDICPLCEERIQEGYLLTTEEEAIVYSTLVGSVICAECIQDRMDEVFK